MARSITVREDWQPPNPALREIARAFPTLVDTGEVDFRGVLRAIGRRKWSLALIMVAGMSAVMTWMSQVTPRYNADALIVIENRPSAIVQIDEPKQEAISDLAQVDIEVAVEVAVLQSQSLATRVIRELGLEHDPEFAPEAPARDGAVARPMMADAGSSTTQRSPLGTWLSAASDGLARARQLLPRAWGYDGDAQARTDRAAVSPPAAATSEVVKARKDAFLLKA